MKDSAADSTFEAPDVPLLVQGNECLALHQLFLAPGTFCKEKKIPMYARQLCHLSLGLCNMQ